MSNDNVETSTVVVWNAEVLADGLVEIFNLSPADAVAIVEGTIELQSQLSELLHKRAASLDQAGKQREGLVQLINAILWLDSFVKKGPDEEAVVGVLENILHIAQQVSERKEAERRKESPGS